MVFVPSFPNRGWLGAKVKQAWARRISKKAAKSNAQDRALDASAKMARRTLSLPAKS